VCICNSKHIIAEAKVGVYEQLTAQHIPSKRSLQTLKTVKSITTRPARAVIMIEKVYVNLNPFSLTLSAKFKMDIYKLNELDFLL
jgi:hypothetical protein